jgi:hypothetical protein
MTGYTKLFSSILDSSVWQENNETRIVWITLLAMSDKNGEVTASIPGLAKRAGVTIKETEAALTKFKSPDKYSTSKEFDGRRIEEIDGGWLILNRVKYRDTYSAEDRKEKTRLRVERYRQRKVGYADVTPVTPGYACNADVTPGNACNADVTHVTPVIGIGKGKGIGKEGSREARLNKGSRLEASIWSKEAFSKACEAISQKHDLDIEAVDQFIKDKLRNGFTTIDRQTGRRKIIASNDLERLLTGFAKRYVSDRSTNFRKSNNQP